MGCICGGSGGGVGGGGVVVDGGGGGHYHPRDGHHADYAGAYRVEGGRGPVCFLALGIVI